MTRTKRIEQKLSVLKPQYLEIIDESQMHKNHKSNPGGDETHLKIIISSKSLDDKAHVAQHRMIYQLLEEEFNSGLHAVSINVRKEKEINK